MGPGATGSRKSHTRIVSSCELLIIWKSSNWSRKTLPECSCRGGDTHRDHCTIRLEGHLLVWSTVSATYHESSDTQALSGSSWIQGCLKIPHFNGPGETQQWYMYKCSYTDNTHTCNTYMLCTKGSLTRHMHHWLFFCRQIWYIWRTRLTVMNNSWDELQPHTWQGRHGPQGAWDMPHIQCPISCRQNIGYCMQPHLHSSIYVYTQTHTTHLMVLSEDPLTTWLPLYCKHAIPRRWPCRVLTNSLVDVLHT